MTKRILLGVTADTSLCLMQGLPERLVSEGWEVHVASDPGPNGAALSEVDGLAVHPLAMARKPSLRSDSRAFVAWLRLLAKVRPDVISVGTPKAGLLGSVAGFVLRVPRRVYVLRGLRYETSKGLARVALKSMERLACASAHEVLAVSHSLAALAIHDRLVVPSKVVVLGRGSSNGVDVNRFATSDADRKEAKKERWPEAADTPTVGFVGRIHPDKGLDLLADAVALLAADGVPGRLLVVGASDSPDGEDLRVRLLESGFDVEFTGPVTDVAPLLRLMDLQCLPTKREGFPNVVLEAAAAGLPTVATNATGVSDAIVDGETGIICDSREPSEMAAALRAMLQSSSLRKAMGGCAYQFVRSHFGRESVQAELANYYANFTNSAHFARRTLRKVHKHAN